MALEAGARIGPFIVAAPLGVGGMGEVYRARDSRLQRDVAIKIIPELFAASPDRLERFKREAQLLGSLNHPNIGSIYGFEEAGGGALVLELVEGPTLDERLQSDPLPLDDALSIARQIVEALEAAHARGIIHRDLKPANIKIRPDGTVKVLDFGLAKVLDETASGELPIAATRTSPALTHAGVILGTAAYMAPEQAKGRPVDARADIWAFGCVLYEMLTRSMPFAGESVSEVIASVLKTEPEWPALPSETPASIRRLLRRCLQKDPARRLQHIGDARLEIDDALAAPEAVGPAALGGLARRERWAWGAAGILGMTTLGVAILALRPSAPLVEIRLDLATPATSDPFSFAVSPDGQKVVFVAPHEGRPHLWLRTLDSTSAQPLAGTDYARSPFWSPDSSSVAFFGDTNLRRLELDSRSLSVVTKRVTGAQGGGWNADGTILFAPNIAGNLSKVPATGGERQQVTRTDTTRAGHRYPQFLPDGRRFLYYVTGSADTRGIYAGSLDGSGTSRLLESETPGVYANGRVLFVNQGKLLAQAFDAEKLEMRGRPVVVADGVAWEVGVPAVSASAAGPIVFRTGTTTGRRRQFIVVDRAGREIERIGAADDAQAYSPAISRDGRRVALHRNVSGQVDIWWFDMGRQVLTRLTTDAAPEIHPLWMPDGSAIIYASRKQGVYDLYRRRISGSGEEDVLLATRTPKRPLDISADGRFLLYMDRSAEEKSGTDIWALPLEGEAKPFPVLVTEFEETHAQFSRDGKWIAYETDRTGRSEICVRSFPTPDVDLQVSTSGGSQVRWKDDGSELFYIALDGRLMSVPIRRSGDASTVNAGIPTPLFVTHLGGAVQRASLPLYNVLPGGTKFLMLDLLEDNFSSPLTVLLNWKPKS